jgi:hypothetical protein
VGARSHGPAFGGIRTIQVLYDAAGNPIRAQVHGNIEGTVTANGITLRQIEHGQTFYDLTDNMDLAEAFLKYILKAVLDERPDDMKFFAERIDKECISRIEKFIDSSFERMTYTDAIAALDLLPSRTELLAVERFRGMVQRTVDTARAEAGEQPPAGPGPAPAANTIAPPLSARPMQ